MRTGEKEGGDKAPRGARRGNRFCLLMSWAEGGEEIGRISRGKLGVGNKGNRDDVDGRKGRKLGGCEGKCGGRRGGIGAFGRQSGRADAKKLKGEKFSPA